MMKIVADIGTTPVGQKKISGDLIPSAHVMRLDIKLT